VIADESTPEVWQGRVGQRVVVRHRLPDGSATDAVGPLLAVTPDAGGWSLRVAGRRGEVVVALDDVVAGKVVPPRPARPAPPHRALAVADLERVTALHWRAPVTAPLGSWLLRAAGGFTGRANSALAAGRPGVDRPAAVAAVRAWYAERGLRPLAALPRPDARAPDVEELAEVAAAFSAAGWEPVPQRGAFVLTAPTAALAAPAGRPPAGLAVALDPRPGAGWTGLYHYRGEPLPPIGVELLLSAPEQVFASALDGDRVVAVARGSLGGGWAGVSAVEVDPGYRRRGLAGLLLARIAAWAGDRGARSTFVQVGETNAAAVRLYESAGFVHHHRYDYLTPR
jgi:GNAT superfamily N-acetyltransferase